MFAPLCVTVPSALSLCSSPCWLTRSGWAQSTNQNGEFPRQPAASCARPQRVCARASTHAVRAWRLCNLRGLARRCAALCGDGLRIAGISARLALLFALTREGARKQKSGEYGRGATQCRQKLLHLILITVFLTWYLKILIIGKNLGSMGGEPCNAGKTSRNLSISSVSRTRSTWCGAMRQTAKGSSKTPWRLAAAS